MARSKHTPGPGKKPTGGQKNNGKEAGHHKGKGKGSHYGDGGRGGKKGKGGNGKGRGSGPMTGAFLQGKGPTAAGPSATAVGSVEGGAAAVKPSSSKLSTTTLNLRFMQRGNAAAANAAISGEGAAAAHPDRWVLPSASAAAGWGPSTAAADSGVGAATASSSSGSGSAPSRTVEVISGFSAFESIMDTRRS